MTNVASILAVLFDIDIIVPQCSNRNGAAGKTKDGIKNI